MKMNQSKENQSGCKEQTEKEENVMESIMNEFTEYICNHLCKIPEVCRILSMKPKTKENKAHASELGETLKKGMTFQMPADSEVVV